MAAVESLSNVIDSMSTVLPNKLDWGIRSEVSYDDNIYSTPRKRKTDSVIFKNSIFANAHRQVETLGSYGLRGSLGYDYYTHDTSDKSEITWELYPYMTGGMSGGGRISWTISINSYAKRERMSDGDTRYARHYHNSITLGADYEYHPRWGILSAVGYTVDKYPQNEFRSYDKHVFEFSLAPYYKLTDKMRIGLRASTQATLYETTKTNDNSRRLRMNLFLDWTISDKMTFYAETGLEKSYYDGATRGSNSEREWLPNGRIVFRYLPVRNFGVSYISTAQATDSTLTRGIAWKYSNILLANWDVTEKVQFVQSAGITWEDQKEGHGDTRETFYRNQLTYKYSKHLSFYTAFEFTNVTYIHVHENDYNESVVKLGAVFTM